MKFLVTGSAGFIGFSLCNKLLVRGNSVVGIDNHNNYYDPKIKEARLKILKKFPNYYHYRIDLIEQVGLNKIFQELDEESILNIYIKLIHLINQNSKPV